MEEYVIVINDIPSSLNKYMGTNNKWQYREEKKLWDKKITYATCGMRPKKTPYKARVIIGYYFKTKARHDPDNYAPKVIMDSLTKLGYIADDSFEHVDLYITKLGVDKKNPRTVITIQTLKED